MFQRSCDALHPLGISNERLRCPVGNPCEHQHAFRVSGKDLEWWIRTSKDVLPDCIEPGALPQPVFDCLWLPFTKGTQGVCEGVEEIGVGFQQRSVAGSKTRKQYRARLVVNGHAIFGP